MMRARCFLGTFVLPITLALVLISTATAFQLLTPPSNTWRNSPGNKRQLSRLRVSAEKDPMAAAREVQDDTSNKHETTEETASFAEKSVEEPSEKTSADTSTPDTTTKRPKNLYEILGASPEDSKEELKRKYVMLAKQTHPDAYRHNGNLSSSNSTVSQPTSDLDFGEIAEAYKILSDRKQKKRYDRQIRAEAISKEIQEFAGDVAEKAAPQVRDMLDNLAMPFLRRTTATTLASIQAAAKEMRLEDAPNQNQTKTAESPDLGVVFASAMKAAQNAGRIVDNIELLEKSEALESQVMDQIDQANKIKAELDNTTMHRVMVALRTPNATFSASDAFQILDYLNISSNPSLLERAKLKNPVSQKIQDLELTEEAFIDKEMELEAAMMYCRGSERALQQARAKRVLALQAEKRAREALLMAQRNVAESKAQVSNTTKSLSQAELAMENIAKDRERMASVLMRQQEDVRKTVLNRKEVSEMIDEKDEEPSLAELEELQNQEAALIKEYSRLEVTASQLQSRANKLRDRAEQLKGMQ